MSKPTIALIGVGAVGATTAHTLITRTIPVHLWLIDCNEKKCSGECYDLEDAAAVYGITTVSQGTWRDAASADICIIMAGRAQKPSQSRIDLSRENYRTMLEVMENMRPVRSDAVIIVVTNPVDLMTRCVQEHAHIAKARVFGSGTYLDMMRLRHALGVQSQVNPCAVDIQILGEHGDTQIAHWSAASIGGVPIDHMASITPDLLVQLADQAKKKIYDIIQSKGWSAYGVATVVAEYCVTILADRKLVIPVSCYLPEYELCMSMPAVLGSAGVERVLQPALNSEELLLIKKSAEFLKQAYIKMVS